MAGRSTIVSLSFDRDLLARLDAWVERRGFASRSAAVQRIVRQELDAAAQGDRDGPAVATVSFVYDHHAREVQDRLTHLQHQHLDLVVSSMHVHLDHERCLEVLVLRGPAREVRDLAERTLATRGVERGQAVLTPVEVEGLSPGHASRGPSWHAAAHDHDHHHGRGRGRGQRKSARPRAGRRRS